MKINLHSPVEEVQVQIIPLIDVIFCILTFFLLAALQFTRQQAISVDLPKASTGTTPAIQQRLIVTLDPAGQIYVEQQPVGFEQLGDTLETYFRANPTALLVLNASRSSSYNDVIQVLDAMREVGGDRVALATIPGTPDQPAGTTSIPGITPGIPPAPGQFPFPSAPGQSSNGQDNSASPISPVPTIPAPQPTTSPAR